MPQDSSTYNTLNTAWEALQAVPSYVEQQARAFAGEPVPSTATEGTSSQAGLEEEDAGGKEDGLRTAQRAGSFQ